MKLITLVLSVALCGFMISLFADAFRFAERQEEIVRTLLANTDLTHANFKGLRSLISDASVADEFFVTLFYEICSRYPVLSIKNTLILIFAANSLATGRLELYEIFLALTRVGTFAKPPSIIPASLEQIILCEIAECPHLIPEAIESPQFQALVVAVNEQNGTDAVGKIIYYFSLNLSLIEFAERAFPDVESRMPPLPVLARIRNRYGLEVDDVREALQYYRFQKDMIFRVVVEQDMSEYPEVVQILTFGTSVHSDFEEAQEQSIMP